MGNELLPAHLHIFTLRMDVQFQIYDSLKSDNEAGCHSMYN